MSRTRDLRVYHAARTLVTKLNETLRRKPPPQGALQLEHYLRDHELQLQRPLSTPAPDRALTTLRTTPPENRRRVRRRFLAQTR